MAWPTIREGLISGDREGLALGLGAIVGDPTALSLIFQIGDHDVLQVSYGWGFEEEHRARMTATVDYCYRFVWLYPESSRLGVLTPYLGVGLKIGLASGAEDPIAVGLRIPVGLAFAIKHVPGEVYFETAMGTRFFPNGLPTFDGGAGARLFF